jgi:Ca2+-transporting ATPase
VGAIIVGVLLQLAVISIAPLAGAFGVQFLSLQDWGLVFLFALVPLIVNEIIKVFMKSSAQK